jgi:hypothetical protein
LAPEPAVVVESGMADVMIAVMPFRGHVAPTAAVARAFVEAGHAVRDGPLETRRDRATTTAEAPDA